MQVRTLAQAIAFGEVAAQYQQLRREYPTIRALTIKRYIHDDEGLTLEQFECSTERGHEWSYSGSAYGGDDDSYFGEGGAIAATAEPTATPDTARWESAATSFQQDLPPV